MKTHNKHPGWYNEPLRLNKEQKQHPILIIDDFFESFHLNEVRDILWRWMVEVVSSPRSISDDHHERNNHIYFYEKIEELVEAAFVLQKNAHKLRRKHDYKMNNKKT
jgi:hypothetical protein